jgi:hypothetical protein
MLIANEVINIATCIFIAGIGIALLRGHFHIHHHNEEKKP